MNKLAPMTAKAVASSMVLALGLTAGTSAAHAAPGTSAIAVQTVQAAEATPELTAEQKAFIDSGLGVEAVQSIESAMAEKGEGDVSALAFPIAAVAIAAAAWCAKGALASVPTSVLDDLSNGGGGTNYARNAIIGCLGGEIGGWAWRVLPGWVKKKAIAMVASFIIRYIR
jgi:hypothetical protein